MSTVPVRTATGPINGNLAVAVAAAAIGWWLWPAPDAPWQQAAMAGAAALCAAACLARGLVLLVRDYRLRRDLARAEAITSDHGTAREATWDEIRARGMDMPASGNFLGLYQGQRPVFAPADVPFSLAIMPPGGGKTSRLVVGSILHQAQTGKSLAISDPKQELGPMLAPTLRQLGFEVWCVNPAGRYLDRCGNVELNPYQAVLDALYAEDEARLDAIKRAGDLAELHLPEKGGDDKNLYFRAGSRRCIAVAILYFGLTAPARCTPSDVFALLNDPGRLMQALRWIRRHLETAVPHDPIVAFLKTEAANLLHRADKNEENFASFLEGATQVLLTFNQGGRLGGYGRTADRNIAELRWRPIILFMMAPLSHTREFAPLISLFNYNLIAACKDRPTGHKVHIVGEEALNYRFADLVSDLETMRGLGITADFYIQSFPGLVRKYGRDAAAAVDSYAGVKVYSALNSFDQAKLVSDLLAEATIRKQDYSFRSVVTDLGVSSRELGRRLMTPDEVLAMPRGEAWVFVQGLRPMRLTLVHYGQVEPWRDWVLDNPIEGRRLRGDPLFRIHYPPRTS
ncbi:type IV secretory pathway TraG/TraD family ATPase VirD4 [Stella humosa]|uniref:Type IV secretory pathway TraG/TraD family ATPase VirD4 n=1 Tax=Stella humosa TaxID=94 RepID=A0A3N1MLX6_9PROT|nr:type IV secretory system conjugative DNA transfer family protein [Stella humosa]ROQ03370.1 type IV secretory pathway TraG/TraD family ATPase VirD4 [Stella humosa]BBK29658.1 conjugal transfer protein TraG [Stella humosa]